MAICILQKRECNLHPRILMIARLRERRQNPHFLPVREGGVLQKDIAQVEKREPEIERRISDKLFTWLENGALKPVVGQVFPFEEFQHAFRAMRDRKAEGKMVISIL